MDESATGSVNFLRAWAASAPPAAPVEVAASSPLPGRIPRAMHFRLPSIDPGVQAFLWALVFFLYLWLGALALGYPAGDSLVLSLIAAGGIFLLVRTRGAGRRP